MRTRHVDTDQEREAVVDELVREGYEVQSESESATELRYKSRGKTWVHILLLLMTVGFGNVVYALWYGRRSKDEVRVVVE